MTVHHWSEIKIQAYDARRVGDYHQAEMLYREALRQALPFAGSDHQVSILYNTIADFYRERGMLETAEQFAREGIGLDRRHLPAWEELLGNDLMFLAMLLDQQGRYAEALPLAEEGVSIYEKELGRENPHVAVQRRLLNSLRQKLKDPA